MGDNMKTPIYTIILLFISTGILCTTAAEAYTISFSPRLSISEAYTDNVYLTPDDDKQSDSITTVSPGLAFELERKITGLSLSYLPAFSYYRKYDDNNTIRHAANGGAWHEIASSTRIDVSGAYIRTEEPNNAGAGFEEEDHPATPEIPADRRIRSIYDVKTAGFEMTHAFGAENTTALGYQYRSISNPDNQFAENNSSHAPFIRIDYTPPQNRWRTEMGISFIRGLYDGESPDFSERKGYMKIIRQFSRRFNIYCRYEHLRMVYDGDTENYRVYHPSTGLEYDYTQDTSLGINIGYFLQDRYESEDNSGMSATADMQHTWGYGQGITHISASSGYDLSLLDTEELGFSTYHESRVSASYSFTKNGSGTILGSIRQDTYKNSTADAPERPERKDILSRVAIRCSWQIKAWVAANIEASAQNLDSNIDMNDYMENKVFIECVLTPSQPIRRVR